MATVGRYNYLIGQIAFLKEIQSTCIGTVLEWQDIVSHTH